MVCDLGIGFALARARKEGVTLSSPRRFRASTLRAASLLGALKTASSACIYREYPVYGVGSAFRTDAGFCAERPHREADGQGAGWRF